MSRKYASIRRRLLVWLTTSLCGVWAIAAYLTYRSAHHEISEVYDANLAQNARIILALLRHEAAEESENRRKLERLRSELTDDDLNRLPSLANMLSEHLSDKKGTLTRHFEYDRSNDHPYELQIAIVGHYEDGSVLLRSASASDFGESEPGFSFAGSGAEGWRVFTTVDQASGLTLQLGERRALRGELVRHVTFSAMAPLIVLLPLLALLAWFAVGRGLEPLVRLAHAIEHRNPELLEPLDDRDVPREAKPLTDSLNRLFARINAALERERRFTADAAHELRTPLAALKTQAQVAQRAVDPVQRAHALARVLTGVDRAAHLVEQLLALAHSDADHPVQDFKRVDLAEIAREVLRELAPGAGSRHIELELTGASTMVSGSPDGLRMLLRNLVDNSIRYSNEGGRVIVSTQHAHGHAELRVTDTGPGIPPEQRADAFKRFRRGPHTDVPGSGLGLSIVQRIAELHGATIEMSAGPEGRGLSVSLKFPG